MEQSIIIIAEHFEGELRPVTYELVGFALQLQRFCPAGIKLVVLGDDVGGLAREAAGSTGLDVVAVNMRGLGTYNGEVYKHMLSERLPDLNPVYICMAHTTQGADLAPSLAVRMEAACITGVVRISEEEGRISFARGMFSGKVIAKLISHFERTVITLQPGSLPPPVFDHPAPGAVETWAVTYPAKRSRSLGIKRPREENAALTGAGVIVSAGRGVGKKENLRLIYNLSNLWPGSAVGGSRPVCDSGWLEYGQQVGTTGATVAPKLYVACGISGASQHVVGMNGSGFIVAINRDPDASIFNVADVCIVEDLITFIPCLIKEHEKFHLCG